jgi:hypothetical protein
MIAVRIGAHKKRFVLLVIVVIFAVIAVVSWKVFYKNSDQESKTSETLLLYGGDATFENTPCSVREQDSILSQASTLFALANYTKMPGSERITKLSSLEGAVLNAVNHEQDANCLHILAMINIQKGDSKSAEKYLSMLELGLEESQPESYVLDENVNFMTIEKMKQVIETLSLNTSLIEKNNPYGNQSRIHEKVE